MNEPNSSKSLETSSHPIHLNESFTCEKCGEKNPKADRTCRDHCRKCLISKHVDEATPGDRKSACEGFMQPVAVEGNGKKGQQLIYICTRCGKKHTNRVADDDNMDLIIRISQKQNLMHMPPDHERK